MTDRRTALNLIKLPIFQMSPIRYDTIRIYDTVIRYVALFSIYGIGPSLHYCQCFVSGVKVVVSCCKYVRLSVISMSDEDWGQLADEQEKKLATTVLFITTNTHVSAVVVSG